MAKPNVLILRAPGTNCDVETAFAFEQAGAMPDLVHVNRLLDEPAVLDRYQILCIPGGFSYGDDVAAGRILASQLHRHLGARIEEFKAAEKLILGICNGFQVLIKSGVLLEPDPRQGPQATLTWNDSGRFEDRWVRLAASASRCVFLAGIDAMYLPVAHAEGKFVPRDTEVLAQMQASGQLVLRYRPLWEEDADDPGAPVPYPDNPNGSAGNVAGVCDATGRVLGLMPHPERHIDRTQHPRWTRGEGSEPGDGLRVFTNAVDYFSS
jgi:phosphoribosylformylglycinamidine synthase